MAYITLEQLKKHLNIDYTEAGDDDYLSLLLAASELRIEQEINQPLSNFVEDDKLHPSLVCAILILASTLYANREAVSYTHVIAVPFTLNYLLQSFRKYT